MAPLPNIGQKAIAGVGSVGKMVKDATVDAVKSTAAAGMAGVVGPELLALKATFGGAMGSFTNTLKSNYVGLLEATNDNGEILSEISELNRENTSSINKLGSLTETGVLRYLQQIADNTSYLNELEEDLAINQARDKLKDTTPTFTAANDNDIIPQEKEKKGMSPLLLASLIIGGISAFSTEFLKALKVGTLKWIKAVGKLTGITALLTKLSKSLKFDDIKLNLKLFYQNFANNISKFKNMSMEAFKNARVAVAERLAALRTSIMNVFKSEGMIGKTLGTIARLPGMISNILQNPFDDLIAGMGQAFTKVRGYVNGLVKGFSLAPVFESLSKVWGFIKNNKIVSGIGKLGSLLGKFFYPLGVIMSIFDGFKEGKEEFDKAGSVEEAFFKGFAGGIRGFLKSFIGIPIDLIKSAVSWIAGKLGFKNAEKFLDSFSFVDTIGNLFNLIINGILEAVANIFDKMGLDTAAAAARKLKLETKNEDGAQSKGQADPNAIKNSGSQILADPKQMTDAEANKQAAKALGNYSWYKGDKSYEGMFGELVEAGTLKDADKRLMVDSFSKMGTAASTINKFAGSLNERSGIVQINQNNSKGGTQNVTKVSNFSGGSKSSSKPWVIGLAT